MNQVAELVRKWASTQPPTRAIEQARDTRTKPRSSELKHRFDDLEQKRQLRELIGTDPY